MHGCSGLRAALCNRATQYYYINIYIPQQVCNVQGCCINSSHSSAEFQGSKFLQQHSKENILFSSEMIYFHCRNKLFLLLSGSPSSTMKWTFSLVEMNILSCWNELFPLDEISSDEINFFSSWNELLTFKNKLSPADELWALSCWNELFPAEVNSFPS